ncbi:hypothetical protein F518_03506 [Serratia marcescens VGH107]|nr:hypothetical protein F518_03506 [Serratia marcescens VGH107]
MQRLRTLLRDGWQKLALDMGLSCRRTENRLAGQRLSPIRMMTPLPNAFLMAVMVLWRDFPTMMTQFSYAGSSEMVWQADELPSLRVHRPNCAITCIKWSASPTTRNGTGCIWRPSCEKAAFSAAFST